MNCVCLCIPTNCKVSVVYVYVYLQTVRFLLLCAVGQKPRRSVGGAGDWRAPVAALQHLHSNGGLRGSEYCLLLQHSQAAGGTLRPGATAEW